jgi:hypothetical protein
MKKSLAVVLAVAALVASAIGFAGTATATPSKTKACSGCHGASSAVVVTVKKKSTSGGKGGAAWAVLKGGKNLAHGYGATGTFKLKKGQTVNVWGRKTGSGANYKTLVVK